MRRSSDIICAEQISIQLKYEKQHRVIYLYASNSNQRLSVDVIIEKIGFDQWLANLSHEQKKKKTFAS